MLLLDGLVFLVAIVANSASSADVGAGCTITRFDQVSSVLNSCNDIVVRNLVVDAGQSLKLFLKAGATLTFEGTTTFAYAEWDGPLIWIKGNGITVVGAQGYDLVTNTPGRKLIFFKSIFLYEDVEVESHNMYFSKTNEALLLLQWESLHQTFKYVIFSGISDYGINVEQNYRNNGGPSGNPNNNVPIDILEINGVTGSLNGPWSRKIYILCASGGCQNFKWSNVNLQGNSRPDSCNFHPAGYNCL
ncbi:polygalacturonase-like [Leptinotarsa decemlineata]|uniref:polygalacturonase-like n=1 Tax=Leptinotarsa decemlineata TaxID=7539 RepID=UPI003D307D84